MVITTTSKWCLLILCISTHILNVNGVCTPGLYMDPGSNTCVTYCPNGLYADPFLNQCSTTCSLGLLKITDQGNNYCVSTCPFQNSAGVNVYVDFQVMSCIDETESCSNYWYQDLTTHTCVFVCPTGFYTSYSTPRKCTNPCSAPLLGDPVTGMCSDSCSAGYFEYSDGNQCVPNCPTGYYQDTAAGRCIRSTAACQDSLFQDPTTYLCVETCPAGLYGDLLLSPPACVATCTSNQFGDPITGLCQSTCHTGWFNYEGSCIIGCPVVLIEDWYTQSCIDQTQNCSNGLIQDWNMGMCVSICSMGSYLDTSSQVPICVLECPSGTFGDPFTLMCSTQCSRGFIPSSNNNECVVNTITSVSTQAKANTSLLDSCSHACVKCSDQGTCQECEWTHVESKGECINWLKPAIFLYIGMSWFSASSLSIFLYRNAAGNTSKLCAWTTIFTMLIGGLLYFFMYISYLACTTVKENGSRVETNRRDKELMEVSSRRDNRDFFTADRKMIYSPPPEIRVGERGRNRDRNVY